VIYKGLICEDKAKGLKVAANVRQEPRGGWRVRAVVYKNGSETSSGGYVVLNVDSIRAVDLANTFAYKTFRKLGGSIR
jgi:hypothetical protein